MTETTFPFEGSTAVPTVAADGGTVPSTANRTRLFAALGGAGLLVLGVLAYFLLFSGGGDPTASPASGTPVPAASPTAATAPTVAPVVVHHLSAKSFGRDPFKALIAESATVAGTAVGGTSGTPASTGTTTTGTITGSTTGTTTGTGTGATTGTTGTTTPTVTAPHTFRVVSVSADHGHVTVRVDGKDYPNLKAGQVFATYFKVVVIGGKVNGFQFGDERFSVFGTKRLYIAA